MSEKESNESSSSAEGKIQDAVQFDLHSDTKRAMLGGGLTALVTFAGAYLVGEVSGTEAYSLLSLSIDSTRRFCGNVMIATGNILALMLTLLSLSSATDIELKWTHYYRVEEIAWGVTVTFISAILVYLLLNIPLEKSDPPSNPMQWMAVFYYFTLVIASLLGGAVITIILMLYNTIKDVILAISPSEEATPSDIVRTEEEKE